MSTRASSGDAPGAMPTLPEVATAVVPATSRFRRLVRSGYFWLSLMIVATLLFHFSLINLPEKVLYDEVHYVPDAKSILAGQGTLRPEHPPLGKLFITAGIALFGDTPLGWRFFSPVFGAASFLLFSLICRRLTLSWRVTLLATCLLAFENMTFVQTGIAMLDVYSLTLMLAAFLLYLRGHYPLAGLFIGLSALAKPVGAFAIGVILLHWLYVRRDRANRFLVGLLIAPLSFVAFLPLLDYVMIRRFIDPLAQIKTMAALTATMTFHELSNPSQSRPWVWLLRPDTIVYSYYPKYLAAISYTIWASAVPVIIYISYRSLRMKDQASVFVVSWFIGTYLVLIPLVLLSDRVTYGYYIYPTIGAICLGLGIALSQIIDISNKREGDKLKWVLVSLVSAFLIGHVVIFALVSPMSYWLGVLL